MKHKRQKETEVQRNHAENDFPHDSAPWNLIIRIPQVVQETNMSMICQMAHHLSFQPLHHRDLSFNDEILERDVKKKKKVKKN